MTDDADEPTRARVYLNHAGTSWPKPAPVRAAARDALEAPVHEWATRFERAHETIAAFFGVRERERLLLTPGCTSALAVGVADLPWRAGDRVLTSAMEHHALHRPLLALGARGVELHVLPRAADGPLDLDAAARELARGGVRLVAVSGAANVTGERLPVRELAELAHAHGALLLLDAAQLAGWEPLDVRTLDVDLLAFAGHKALQGVWGIGGLYVAPGVRMQTPLEGERPDYCDAGSVDRAALAALASALDWLSAPERAGRTQRALAQLDVLARVVAAHDDVTVHGAGARVPTLAFTIAGRAPDVVARALADAGVQASGGHQCAPLAHASLGTAPGGAVRLSVGPATTDEDVAFAADALARVLASD